MEDDAGRAISNQAPGRIGVSEIADERLVSVEVRSGTRSKPDELPVRYPAQVRGEVTSGEATGAGNQNAHGTPDRVFQPPKNAGLDPRRSFGRLQPRFVSQQLGLVDTLPGQIEVRAAEMPVGGHLLVERT